MLWHSLVHNFLWLLGVLHSIVIPNSFPFLVSLSPPNKENILPCSRRCRAVPTDTAILFWRERTGLTDEAKIIHSFCWFICSNMHKNIFPPRRKERGGRRHFSVSDLNQFFFFQNFSRTWWYFYTKQRLHEIIMLVFHWSTMSAGKAWQNEGRLQHLLLNSGFVTLWTE